MAPKVANLAYRPANQPSSTSAGSSTTPLAASPSTGSNPQASASNNALQSATPTDNNTGSRDPSTEASKGPLDQWRDGLRPPKDVSIGEDVNVMTNTVWITKTPPTIYEYEVEFSRTLPTSGPNGNRQARAVARREEKAMIFRAFQQRLNPGNAQQGVHNGVNFAFSHQCDLIWTVSPMPGSFTNNVQHFDTIQYSRKDGVQETLDRLSIRRRNTHSFNASITTQDVHGTAAQPLNGDPLLALLTAFVSQHALMNVNTVKVGANRHFQPSNAPFNTQLSVVSLKIAQGFLLTVRAVRHGLGILINNTTTCFVQEQTVAQYIRDLRSRRLDNRYLNTVLRGLRVKININRGSSPAGAGPSRNRDALEYRVKSIWSAGQNLRFQQYYANAGDPTGRSVLNFFQNTYAGQAPPTGWDPNLPCINVGGNEAVRRHEAIWYPAECLTILPGQPAPFKAQQLFVSDIIRTAARHANVSRDAISNNGLTMMGLRSPNALTQNFPNFQHTGNLATIRGKMLPAPTIDYGKGINPRDNQPRVNCASWNIERVRRFVENGQFSKIPVLALYENRFSAASARQRAQTWITDSLVIQLRQHGWQSADASQFPVTALDSAHAGFQNEIRRVLGDMKAAKDNLVLVVLPNDRQDTYSLVKRAADIYVGIPTSCIVSNKIRNLSAQYTSNVILKMNLRLKGRDHEFKGLEAAQGLPIESMLVMGADVLHQGVSTGSGAPSISCVVGSSEPTFTKYLPSMRAQAAGEERILDMAMMVAHRLWAWENSPLNKEFKDKQGKTHRRQLRSIVFFRDGVSTSQIDSVCRREIQDIETALSAYQPKPESVWPTDWWRSVRIVYIIVTKRHATRFFPAPTTKPAHVDTRHGQNIAPGLLVDREITHEYQHDFYLQSHQALKGTARPAHYQVIRNDLRLNADAVATLVHSFHYAWSRATKGISYATPAFAADAALNYANACKWLVYADANPPAQQQNQTIQQYRDQCFRWAMHLPANASWNQAGRWGPWQENLDLVMMYT